MLKYFHVEIFPCIIFSTLAEELSGDHDDAVDMPDINITLPSKPR